MAAGSFKCVSQLPDVKHPQKLQEEIPSYDPDIGFN